MPTEELITTLLQDKFGVPSPDIAPDRTFDQLGIDSLIIVELALVLRKQLGVPLEDDELYPELTVQQAADLLDDKVAA
ncbi:acyl carrier protein [Jatrophihabitans sp.]|uniref:acyl carrier protein n=1 Tax=Jatrophihabitans sp. TaxID=1932789 RepID=UPI002CE71955|nr:acyl carrier protein [Jatrophihabitans sp.]